MCNLLRQTVIAEADQKVTRPCKDRRRVGMHQVMTVSTGSGTGVASWSRLKTTRSRLSAQDPIL